MLTIFLICFWVGVVLTVMISLFGGHHTHLFHFHLNTTNVHFESSPSPFNLTSALAFLTVFGGVGFILEKTNAFGAWMIILISLVAGLVIGFVFFLIIAKIFKYDDSMRESNYTLEGQLGYLSVPITGTGVGEMKYVLHGTIRSISVRSEHGNSIAKGKKVIILRAAKGIAVVMEFDDENKL